MLYLIMYTFEEGHRGAKVTKMYKLDEDEELRQWVSRRVTSLILLYRGR